MFISLPVWKQSTFNVNGAYLLTTSPAIEKNGIIGHWKVPMMMHYLKLLTDQRLVQRRAHKQILGHCYQEVWVLEYVVVLMLVSELTEEFLYLLHLQKSRN
jgi:hypothetical protein